MTWPVVAGVLGGIILLGGAIKSLPTVWSFLRAALQAPLVIEQILHEFRPNNGGSMRDAIDRLEKDVRAVKARVGALEHLREQDREIDALGREGRVERRREP